MNKRTENGLILITIIALVATLGSLYFSEVKGFVPCTLCWYQRIIMYPLVLIGGIALYQKNANIAFTTAIFSMIGIGTSLYHYSIQKLAFFRETAPSCGDTPCTGQYINYLGFITIPFLALIAFTSIFVISLLLMKWKKETIK